VEAYAEVWPFRLAGLGGRWGTLRLYDALGYTHARYESGPYAGTWSSTPRHW
jgi:hypothetical protein